MTRLKICALAAIAWAIAGCDSSPNPAAEDAAAAASVSGDGSEPAVADPVLVGATGVPIDPTAKTVLVVNAPAVVSASAVSHVAGLQAQQRETQSRLTTFMDDYSRSLDDPAARQRLTERSAADLEIYKRQALELYNAQRALPKTK